METIADKLMDTVQWEIVIEPQPFTHRGTLSLGEGLELECLQLSNCVRTFTEESILKFLGATP